MIEQKVLAAATQRNILTQDQAEQLAALARELAEKEGEPLDRERLRLVTGFSDIFVTIGIALFVSAIHYFATLSFPPYVAFALVACVAWLLAEVFTLRRRQALPSIVLLGIFALAVFSTSNWILVTMFGDAPPYSRLWGLYSFLAFVPGLLVKSSGAISPFIAASAAITALAVAIHYLRFRVPVTVAVGTGSLAAFVLASLGWAFPALVLEHFRWLLLATGLAVFALAMRFDLSDPERETRRTDIAFWLHLYAAPVIVHSLVSPMMTGGVGMQVASAVSVVIAVLLLSAISLVIDRRALLVSSLIYLGFAVGSLSVSAGFSGPAFPLALLVLGGFVLMLSAGWSLMRNALLRLLPERLTLRLPRSMG